MSVEKTIKNLDILIRARCPIIYCQSFEEARVEGFVRKLSEKRGAELLKWTRTKGFVDANDKTIEKIQAPEKALSFIEERQGSAVFMLKDFHPYLKDPGVVRQMRDLCQSLKLNKKNIILLSPTLQIPVELTKEIAVVDVPLPDRSEIEKIYESAAHGVGAADAKEASVEAALGLTQDEVENVFAKSLVAHGKIDVTEILTEKRQIVQKAGILDFIPVKGNFNSIGGLGNLKYWLERRKNGFSQKARDINLPSPKGILLIGLPGCGKSLTAVCTGAAWQMPLLRLDMGKIFSGLVGSSEENMRLALKTAESVSPCILWIDEIEKGMSGSSSSGSTDGGTTSRVFGTFLTWMQEKESSVFVLATANDISGLPPEMLRKGRFDEIFFVDTPSTQERLEILNIHLKKRGWNIEGLNEQEFIKLSDNFSGAEIEQALIDARYESFFQESELSMEMLAKALKGTVPLFKTMRERIDGIRSWAKERAVPASVRTEVEGSKVRPLEITEVA